MTNREAVERFDTAHGIKINKMFWVAGCLESSDFKEMVTEDMSHKDLSELFPDLPPDAPYEYMKDDEATQLFVDYNKLGFLVELHFPYHYGFHYKKEEVT